MIQIQREGQFANAMRRAKTEGMHVRPTGQLTYEVTNKTRGTRYRVRFVSINGKPFGQCSCAAGTPTHADQAPLVCKHLFAAVTVHLALARMQAKAMTASTRVNAGPKTYTPGLRVPRPDDDEVPDDAEAEALGAAYDGDD